MTKILLVEDDKSLREIYGVRLLAEGYDIVSAGDGEEALAMAIKEKPTLIISDVMMPKISGFDMLDILRSTTETRDIKVIMMTALSSDDQRARGEQLGADRYLVKSQVGIEDVVRTVHEVLGDAPAAGAAAASAPAPATPASDTTASDDATTSDASAAPSNLGAGPLPPQPVDDVKSEESTLPQPTAPFSSPRPTNLGEEVLESAEKPEEELSVAPEQINAELSATAEPVSNSQVDEAISDKDIEATEGKPANEPVAPAVDPIAPSVSPAAPASDDKPPVTPGL
jgi:CheY-like chemotaxis protein